MAHICYRTGLGLAFGKISFEREDVLLVDEITPNTRYTNERIRPVLVRPDTVIARGDRYDMQGAARAGNALLRPYPSIEKVVAAALKTIKDSRQ